MKDFIQKYKNAFTILVVVVAVFIAYSIFFTGEDSAPLTTDSISTSESAVERELIALLLELRSIELDESLFEDERFRSLEDFSQDIIAEPVGRNNPFAPLGQ